MNIDATKPYGGYGEVKAWTPRNIRVGVRLVMAQAQKSLPDELWDQVCVIVKKPAMGLDMCGTVGWLYRPTKSEGSALNLRWHIPMQKIKIAPCGAGIGVVTDFLKEGIDPMASFSISTDDILINEQAAK